MPEFTCISRDPVDIQIAVSLFLFDVANDPSLGKPTEDAKPVLLIWGDEGSGGLGLPFRFAGELVEYDPLDSVSLRWYPGADADADAFCRAEWGYGDDPEHDYHSTTFRFCESGIEGMRLLGWVAKLSESDLEPA
jgi:hypothetical protein